MTDDIIVRGEVARRTSTRKQRVEVIGVERMVSGYATHDPLTLAQLRALVDEAEDAGCPPDARVLGRNGTQWCVAVEWDD